MKEEIEMNKLIELINEYEKEIKKSEKVWSIDNDWDICRQTYEWVDYNEYTEYMNTNNLISKNYGFIKWLVENEKIDFTKDCIEEFWYYWTEWHCDKYDNILMNLAIQDNPISFLSSVLK